MPYTSVAQEKFMNAVRHNPQFAKKVGVSKKVANEFHNKDKKHNPMNRMVPKDVAAVKKMGKKGDTQLVHVGPHEIKFLEAMSGNKSHNPKTGLRQFYNVAGGSIAAGEREGYSGGGGGGTAGAHKEAGRNQPGHGVKFDSDEERKAFADKYYSKATTGETIGGIVTEAILGGANMLTGGLLGALRGITGLDDNPFGQTPEQRMDAALAGPANTGSFSGGSGKAPGGKGGGGQVNLANLIMGQKAGLTPRQGQTGTNDRPPTTTPATPATPTNQLDLGKSPADILLEKYKLPGINSNEPGLTPYTLDQGPHQELVNTILSGR